MQQLVLGLLRVTDGCSVGVEVLAGNSADLRTVAA